MVVEWWLDAVGRREAPTIDGASGASSLRRLLRQNGLRVVAAAAGSYAIFAAGYVSFKRVRYPFDLEWMEGGSLVHVDRVLHGAPLYTAPSLDWTPYIYTPLYWYVSAGFAKVMGLGLFAPRLVSLLATGISLLSIYASVRRHGSRLAAFLAAALFAATFRLSGTWFDLARPDMLACAFGCSAIWAFGVESPSKGRAIATGLLLAGAVLAKQTWLIATGAIAVACLLDGKGRALLLVPSFVLPLVGFWTLAHFVTGGWSTYYTLKLPFEHDLVDGALSTFIVTDIAKNYGPVTCLATVALVLLPRSRRRFYGIVAAGCLGSALSARLHTGAYDNVLIPGYVVLSMLAGHAIAEADREQSEPSRSDALGLLALTAVVVQIASLHYDVKAELPTREDKIAGKHLLETLKAKPGEAWMPNHGSFCLAAGKPCHAHWMAMNDVLRGKEKRPRELLLASARSVLASGRIATLVLDDTFGGELVPIVDKYYPKRAPLPEPGPTPKTGYITRPNEIRSR